MKDISLQLKFVFKFLTKYFLYGYLCLLGTAFFSFLTILLLKKFIFPVNLLALIFFVALLLFFLQFVRILFSTEHKYRYYKITLYRLKTRGYKDSYFEIEMYEPCFRLIIKDLLYSHGYSEEYKGLKVKCKQRDIRVDRTKELLLAKVKKRYQISEKMS